MIDETSTENKLNKLFMIDETRTEDYLREHRYKPEGENYDLITSLAMIKLRLKHSDNTVYNSEVERCFIQLIEAIKNMETK